MGGQSKAPPTGRFGSSMTAYAPGKAAPASKRHKAKARLRRVWWASIAVVRLQNATMKDLTALEKAKLQKVFDESGGLSSLVSIRNALHRCGQYLTDVEILDLLHRAGHTEGQYMGIDKITKMLRILKRKEHYQETDDTADAFVALGGGQDLTGEINADVLRRIVKRFGLTIDIERLLQEVDTDNSGLIEFEEFEEMFESEVESRRTSVEDPDEDGEVATVGGWWKVGYEVCSREPEPEPVAPKEVEAPRQSVVAVPVEPEAEDDMDWTNSSLTDLLGSNMSFFGKPGRRKSRRNLHKLSMYDLRKTSSGHHIAAKRRVAQANEEEVKTPGAFPNIQREESVVYFDESPSPACDSPAAAQAPPSRTPMKSALKFSVHPSADDAAPGSAQTSHSYDQYSDFPQQKATPLRGRVHSFATGPLRGREEMTEHVGDFLPPQGILLAAPSMVLCKRVTVAKSRSRRQGGGSREGRQRGRSQPPPRAASALDAPTSAPSPSRPGLPPIAPSARPGSMLSQTLPASFSPAAERAPERRSQLPCLPAAEAAMLVDSPLKHGNAYSPAQKVARWVL